MTVLTLCFLLFESDIPKFKCDFLKHGSNLVQLAFLMLPTANDSYRWWEETKPGFAT